ncbi:ATP-dependent Clp protease proteolytic subunit [Brunnivagina elsteri]|uniref:ATP-dependent Clp protease proteolytic subunit n=1 Tax=Brunnivagina elsteri CCALA 953 TaxID=987040 RepID=A0A2A2TH11_9CYAN|nr:ATP-dependent Clp protease proteolytic subunit [Calothrix elsteri]PAX53097.1 ATP-dependent Clp protease proteolytic subunit [Calothrix elsteri CCALA 953]
MDNSPIKAVQAPYYGDNNYRTPPPDLQSLLLKERIVYLGLPLYSGAFQALGYHSVADLIVAQLLYLQSDDPEKPIKIYINSTGTSGDDGNPVGYETEAFAVYDTMQYIKPPIHTICMGMAVGMAAMILAAGTKGCRASLPNASIVLQQPKSYAQGQATDIQIRAKEVLANKATMVEILSHSTGQEIKKIEKDMDRLFYMTPYQAVEYGLLDRVFEKNEVANPPIPASVL